MFHLFIKALMWDSPSFQESIHATFTMKSYHLTKRFKSLFCMCLKLLFFYNELFYSTVNVTIVMEIVLGWVMIWVGVTTKKTEPELKLNLCVRQQKVQCILLHQERAISAMLRLIICDSINAIPYTEAIQPCLQQQKKNLSDIIL